MDALERSYQTKKAAYENMIKSSHPDVAKLKQMNDELSSLLNSMMLELAKVKEDAGHIEQYRQELVAKLVAIQKDYTALAEMQSAERDNIETLRALRTHEETKFNGTLIWYSIALGFVSIFFFLVLMWKGGYKAPAIPTPMISATSTPAFM